MTLIGDGTGVLVTTESFIPTSAVAICNMALGHLGARPITQIDEASQEARYSKIFWDITRDEVLRSYPWNFAETRRLLAAVTLPTLLSHRTYAYVYPTDCLSIRKLTTQGDAAQTAYDYDVVSDSSVGGSPRKLIVTDLEEAMLVYTAKIEDTTLWDASFVASLALALAAKLAVPITKNPKMAEIMLIKFSESLPKAKRADSREAKVTSSQIDPWETARFGGNT